MADNPWEDARVQNEQAAQIDQEQSALGKAGLGGAIALMAAGMFGPAAVKKGVRAGIKAVTRKEGFGTKAVNRGRKKLAQATRQQRNKRLRQAQKARASKSQTPKTKGRRPAQRYETESGRKAPTPPSAKDIDQRKALDNMSGIDRLTGATAAAGDRFRREGRVDLTKFVSDLGMRGAEDVQKAGQKFRQFRQSKAVKEKGMMTALSEAKGQRKILSSAISQHVGVEAPQFLGAAYAIDSQMGITGGEDRAFYDVQGHVQDFAEYLPTYAALEVGGVGAMSLAGRAKAAMKGMPSPLEGKAEIAQGIGKAFDTVNRGAKALAELGEESTARMKRVQARESGRAEGLMNQVKGFARGKKEEFDTFMKGLKGGEPGSGRGSSRGEYDLRQISDNFKSLEVLFGDGDPDQLSGAWRDTLGRDNADEIMSMARDQLFSESGTQSQSLMGRMFGAKRVKLKDIDHSKLDDESKKLIQKAKEGKKTFDQMIDDKIKSSDTTKAEVENLRKVKKITDNFDIEQMDLDGFGDIGGKITRMPHNEELTQMGYRIASGIRVRTPSAQRGQGGQISVANVLGLDAYGVRTSTVRELQGGISMQRKRLSRDPNKPGEVEDKTDMLRFGGKGELDHDTRIKRGIELEDVYETGFAIKTGDGFKRSRMYGVKEKGVERIGDAFLSGRSRGKMYRSQARRATPDEYYGRSQRERVRAEGTGDDAPKGFMGKLMESMRLGSHEGSIFTRMQDMMGAGSPRQLFSEDSAIWNKQFKPGETTPEEELMGADALNVIRQAGINATDSGAYTNKEVFQHAVDELGPKIGEAVDNAGGLDKVLMNSRAAATVAEEVLKKHSDTVDEAVRAPTTSHARKIIGDYKQDPASIHNPSGERRGDVLRRFIFEQGALGTSDPVKGMRNVDSETARGAMSKITRTLDDMQKKGRLDKDTVQEAKVGLMGLDMQRLNEGRFRDPYKQVARERSNSLVSDVTTSRAFEHMKANQDLLTQFAESRPRMDVRYNRDAFSAKDNYHKSFSDTGEFAVEDPGMGMAKAFIEAGFDTSRRALDMIGMGWSPNTSLTTREGANEFAKTMLSRGAGIVGGTIALRAADVGTEAAVGTAAEETGLNLPLKDGLVQEMADIAANAHLGASKLYDVFGVTEMAQYMEGLAPGSVTTVAGAAVGSMATGGVLGAIAGATIGKVMQPLLTNTPFEALSILPPLAPFVSDMAEPYESVRDKYEGRKHVPVRSGRYYLLSGTPYEGENIEQYRPNWYVQQSSDYRETSVQYGSAVEEALFKDLPLIGFAPGDLVDPQYLDKKQAADRPYAEASRPFSNVPFFGAILGKYAGGAYNAIHPLASNEPVSPQAGMSGVGTADAPTPGGVVGPGAAMAAMGDGPPADATKEYDTRSVVDQTFYNTTQALGMSGFLLRETAGGKGVFRDERVRSADEIDDGGRMFHDMQLGDLLGAGEAARRIQPYDRGGDTAPGPRNTMAEWMPDEFKCVTPDTIVEVEGSKLRAAGLIQEGDTIRTHKGNLAPVTGINEREMNEDETLYDIDVGGMSPMNTRVTGEHPFWTETGWKELEDIEEGDFVGYPLPDIETLFEQQTVIDLAEYLSPNAVILDADRIQTCTGYEIPRYIDIDTPEFGTLAGYFVAEGSADQSGVCMPITGEFGEEYADAFESVFSLRPKAYNREYESITRWTVHNTVLGRFFRAYFGSSSYNKELHLTKNNWKNFLRTLFNGDGCFFISGADKYQCSLKQNHNPGMLYHVWQVALSQGIVGAVSDEALVFRCDQAVEFARLIGLDKAEGLGVFVGEIKPNVVDLAQYIDDDTYTITDNWIYNTKNDLHLLIEYIEQEKDGDPYWNRGEVKKACKEVGVSWNKNRGPKARRSYYSLLDTGKGGLYRIPRKLDVNNKEVVQDFTRGYVGRRVLTKIIQGLRADDLIPGQRRENFEPGGGAWRISQDYWWTKIKRKEEVETENVISINVVGDHSFCLPGVATHNSGDPYCLTPNTKMEAGGELRTAEDVHEIVQSGKAVDARTHIGRPRRITASKARTVDEEIVEIHVEGRPWPLTVTKAHPIWVQKDEVEQKTEEWVLAGEIAKEPERYRIVEAGAPRHYETSGQRTKALMTLRRVAPPPSDTYHTANLSAAEEHTLNIGFELKGSPYSQRRSKELTELRREMHDYGFPKELIGACPAALQPLVVSLAETKTDERGRYLEIEIDAAYFQAHKDAHVRKQYRSPYGLEERIENAAYRLALILTSAETPAEIEETESGYVFRLRGVQASYYLMTKHQRHKCLDWTEAWRGNRIPRYRGKGTYRQVTEVNTFHYEGPVYAFQVKQDETFTVGGLVTHNSKIAMGEALLPGEGLEATGALTGGEAPLEARNLGADDYETAMRQLDLEAKDSDSWAKRSVQEQLLDSGAAVRKEASYVDQDTGLTAVSDAATKSNAPILIETLSDEEFNQLRDMRGMDRRRLNLTMGAAKSQEGVLTYVNQRTGQTQIYGGQFDQQQYQEDIGRLERGREAAYEYQEQGYGARGAMYSTTDRMQVLQNADPFSDEYRREERRAQKMYHADLLSMEERSQFEQIVGQQREMRKPFAIHEKRFSGKRLMNPADDFVNRSYNENVQAATNYSLPERAVGAMWEEFTSLRTPFHTKLFGQYSAEEQYERKVLLERDFQSWGSPYDDFVRPYMSGLASADDPVQGAASFGTGGLLFGNPAAGAVGAAAGAVYGAARGAYESISGNSAYVPDHIQEARQTGAMMDRVRYMRGQALYEATGDRQYQEDIMKTAIGWSQAGMNEDGWAKERRGAASPSSRFESRMYNNDQGFSSPYRGLRKVTSFMSAVGRKHDDDLIKLTTGSVGKHASAARRAKVHTTSRAANPRKRARIRHESMQGKIEGFSGSGLAKLLRSENTKIQSDLGFGSPYQGQNPEAALNWHGSDPTFDPLPPEMLTGYSAMPSKERDFFRPFAMTQDAEAQDRILDMVSPEMATMMETSWNYLHDREHTGRGLEHQPGARAALSSHPVMGGFANPDSYEIRTAQQQGMNADEVGLGWKGAMERLEGSMVEPAAIESVADITRQADRSVPPAELQQMIYKALMQAGVLAEVDVQRVEGPSEIHIRDEL